ncbi:MAG TPA: hypothetical protein VFA20_02565 [Myxococcaceae bacterium]|nr:hypothetical protein [Myxococcaceae bacterium]
MNPLPRLLETYAEARMLLEAKGWPLAAAAEYLAEMPGLKRFHISQAKISKRTTPGSKFPIEPEVAAAVEEMETRIGYERQTEIVTAGLRAAHGDRGSAGRARLPAVQRVSRFLRKLAERFRRASWRPIIISAGSGALVGCLALLVAPLLAGAAQPGPLMVMVFGPGADEAPVRFDPRSLFDSMPAKWGEKPLDQPIPKFTLPGQKVAPCDAGLAEVAINGNCWLRTDVKPPCGRLFRHEDSCYRPIAADPKKPIGPTP